MRLRRQEESSISIYICVCTDIYIYVQMYITNINKSCMTLHTKSLGTRVVK